MHQHTLFDDERPAKIARDSDPETSHDAAAEMLPKLGKLEARLLAAFKRWPKTVREAADDAARLFRCLSEAVYGFTQVWPHRCRWC